MPRTPLFRDVQRTLRFAAALEATHTPTVEGIERALAERFRWSRRRFLQTAAVAAAGVLVGAPRFARAAASSNDVVIVGAGVSGLTCAYRLQQNGVEARVLEASTRVGGRMYSLRNHFPDGQLTELGGEFFDSDHRAVLGLARELGVEIIDLAWVNGTQGNAYWFGGKLIPTDSHLIDEFRPVAAKIVEQIGAGGENCGVDWKNHPLQGAALDKQSISQWLQENKIGSPIADILKIAYTGEYGLDPDDQSALNLVCLIGTEPDLFSLLGESDERFHAVEGNDVIPQRLAQRLDREVELGTQLVRLGRASDGRYELTVQRGAATDVIKAGSVVISLPFTVLRKVEISDDVRTTLPPAQQQAIRELGYGTNSKLICGFDRRVWVEKGFSGATFSDLGYQSCWETSRGQAGTHGLLTNYLGGKAGVAIGDGSEGDNARRFAGQVDKIFPGAAKAFTGEAVRFTWPSYPYTRGSYTCYRPGQYQAFAGSEGLAAGGLHFCGEHTSPRFSGFMNGAVESGERAAREVLD